MEKFAIISLLTAGIALAGCQTAKDELMESGGIKLKQKEALVFASDVTAPWISGKGAGYNAPDGTYYYKRTTGEAGVGKWSIQGDGTGCLQVDEFWGMSVRCNWETYMRGSDAFLYDIEKGTITQIDLSKRVKGNQL